MGAVHDGNHAIAKMLLNAIAFRAELGGQTVTVDDTYNGKAQVRGRFGQEWTHGGWAEVTKKTVPVDSLTNVRAVLQDGTEVTPVQYKAMVAGVLAEQHT